MPVEIRLARHGRRNLPHYRIVAADRTKPATGRYIELLGRYNTLTDPPKIDLDQDRVKHWVNVGAQLSDTVRQIVKKEMPGYFEGVVEKRRTKIKALRSKRKARQAKSTKKK